MSAKFWRLDNQRTARIQAYKLPEYQAMLADSAFTAEECNDYFSKIPQKTTKKQVRNPMIRKESEQKNPSPLLIALINRAIYGMMTDHIQRKAI